MHLHPILRRFLELPLALGALVVLAVGWRLRAGRGEPSRRPPGGTRAGAR